jgi:hypothetical protein
VTLSLGARAAGVAIDHVNRQQDDFYPTPPAVTRALLSVETFDGDIWEPACGDGAISKVLIAAGYEVVSTDLVDRGYGDSGVDFLMEYRPLARHHVTNPPFKFVGGKGQWIEHALRLTPGKVALFMRIACLTGAGRCRLYRRWPPARIWVFPKRPAMRRNGEGEAADGLLDFAWFVWDRHPSKTEIGWLDDYDPALDAYRSWEVGIAAMRERHRSNGGAS